MNSDGPELPELEGNTNDGVRTTVISVDGQEIRVVEMSQMPMMRILPIMAEPDGTRQMMMLIELFHSALMNPKDWDRVMTKISVEQMQNVLGQWTASLEVDVETSKTDKTNKTEKRKWFGKKKRR